MARKNEEPTNADMIAALVAGTATIEVKTLLRPINYRIPLHVLATVDAMAEAAGKSRNFMLTELLQLGVEAVEKALPTDAGSNVGARGYELYTSYLEEAGETESEEY